MTSSTRALLMTGVAVSCLVSLHTVSCLVSLYTMSCLVSLYTVSCQECQLVRHPRLDTPDKVVTVDRALKDVAAFKVLLGTTRCKCRHHCSFRRPSCTGYSHLPNGTCLLSVDYPSPLTLLTEDPEGGAWTYSPTVLTGAVYVRDLPSTLAMGADGRLYFPSPEKLNFYDCRKYCNSFCGFRLAQGHTKEAMTELRKYPRVIIDLVIQKLSNGGLKFMWGGLDEVDPAIYRTDTTEPILNHQTSIPKGDIMVLWGSVLDDFFSTGVLNCLCQGRVN